MSRSILIATKNPHKQEKLSWIIKGFFDQIDMLNKANIEADLDEKGSTFEEVATYKAIFYSKKYKGYVIATDSGMRIPALGKKWNGLLTKRFVGRKNVSDFERMDKLLELMKDKKGEERTMCWKEALAITKDGEKVFSCEVEGSEGLMQERYDPRKYKKGIWLCSLWHYPQFGKNFFDLTEEETKQAEISWWRLRGKTRKFLKTYFRK